MRNNTFTERGNTSLRGFQILRLDYMKYIQKLMAQNVRKSMKP